MIYTPRVCIDLLQHPKLQYDRNKQVCTKIEFQGYEISVSMDSSHGPGNLARTDIRVYTNPGAVPGVDCTSEFFEEGETMLFGDADTLFRVMKKIKELNKE